MVPPTAYEHHNFYFNQSPIVTYLVGPTIGCTKGVDIIAISLFTHQFSDNKLAPCWSLLVMWNIKIFLQIFT